MTNTIKYDFGAIEVAAGDIRQTNQRIMSHLEDLKATIAPMVDTWQGDSSVAYQDAQRRWDEAAQEISVVLGTIAQTVSDGNARMQDTNARAAASWA